ncbi:MAG: hypothetical protein GWO41_09750 [candidate division Zixibacteria bacterium]|jgi:hypothetical protein|nr:hypothetical protein [candidate division Zixibacteria bacterium]NIR65938.1 hypothetical protein [candidate division Zixibacteria bacterium]NIS16632.1 hypothetical protein [candidate division Zixibacteria bacterium]NIS47582.1 hypothetical protein [candidate division Zixibacteria bacterium]NIT53002.1 hypothetical protein [candidate division Zixibacteria bacterium]
MNDKPVFSIKDCTLITRMAGLDSALNIREMRERVAICPIECLYHHYCETVIRPTFDDPEFRNDFSIWCSTHLGDKKLAEQLGILNPYDFNNLEELRIKMMEVIDERLSELYYIPSAQIGEDFQFMRAVTVVFDTGKQIHSPDDLIRHIPFMSDSSLYYHFVEAHRRTPESTDDFTVFLKDFNHEYQPLIEEFAKIDFYFLNLHELRLALKKAIESIVGAEVPGA